MAFLQFSKTQYIKTIDTAESIAVGNFQLAAHGELKYIRVLLYINGITSLGGSEQIRMKIYGDSLYSSLLYTSDYSDISDITSPGTTNWLGYFRLDFDRENLNKNITYYVKVETNSYTRSGDTFYLGLSYDYPYSVYDNSEANFHDHPLACQIFTYT